MFKRRRRHSFSGVLKLGTAALALWGGYWLYQNAFTFNPDKILENSELKQRNFETKVEEVFSRRHRIKAYLFQDKTNPIISLRFIFKNAGLATDDADKVGIASMAAALLTHGAGELDNVRFNEELENNGIGLSFGADKDDFGGTLITTKDNRKKAFELLKSVLNSPRFDKGEIEQVRAQMLMSLKQQQERPERVLELAFAKALYKNHPYARNPIGEKEDIFKINQEQLKEFVVRHLSQNNLVVGVAGDVDAEELSEVLDEVFGGLPQTGSINFVRPAEVDFMSGEVNVFQDTAQNMARFAAPGVERKHPDFYPLYIANYIFGGAGLNSRLNVAAREKQGLTYGIYTYLSLSDKSALISGGFSSTPENFAKVKEILLSEWQKFGRDGVSAQELKDAKDYLVSSYNLRFASIDGIADMAAYMQKDDLGLDFLQKRNDYVRSVTLEDINRVIKKYFNKNALLFVNSGKFE